MRPTALIDGDIEAFKAASVSQESIDWGDDDESVDVNPERAEDYLVSALKSYQKALSADKMIVCLSSEENFRKQLCPDYKANRQDKPRPVLLEHCKKFLAENYESACWPRLEADDVMGILSGTIKNSVIVSVDKDMKTVPCRLYNPNTGFAVVDEVEAFEWHMTQTLMGDTTDGYKGCPGVGFMKARRVVGKVFDDFNPIQNYSLWRTKLWESVKCQYLEKGLTEADALMNARLAYILRLPKDYNRTTSKIRLWQPPR